MNDPLLYQYQHVISALSAIGTLAAVVISLWLSSATRKPKLLIRADIRTLIPSEAQGGESQGYTINFDKCERNISVTIQNIGLITSYISYWSFFWRIPLVKGSINSIPYYPDFRAQNIKLESGQSATISLSKDLSTLNDKLSEMCSKNRIPRFFKYFTTLEVTTESGHIFKAKVSKKLVDEVFFSKKSKDNE